MPNRYNRFKALTIGVSTGGVSALKRVLGSLPADFPIPILIVTHMMPASDNGLAVLLNTLCAIRVKEADDQDVLAPGTVYIAPANYHLLVDRDGTLALSIDAPVNFARPSIDVLFESAADAFGPGLIAVVMTGAGDDGSKGLVKVQECGGLVIVQDPADAEMDSMPRCAMQLLNADHVVPLVDLPPLLLKLVEEKP